MVSTKDKLIENRKCQKVISKLQANIKDAFDIVMSDVKDTLRAHFSDIQIKIFLEGEYKVAKWSNEDLSRAVNLRSLSTNVYSYLRNKDILPLPSMATITRWVAPALLMSIVHILKYKADTMSEFDGFVFYLLMRQVYHKSGFMTKLQIPCMLPKT